MKDIQWMSMYAAITDVATSPIWTQQLGAGSNPHQNVKSEGRVWGGLNLAGSVYFGSGAVIGFSHT